MDRPSLLLIAVMVSTVLLAGPASSEVRTVTDFGDDGSPGQLRTLVNASAVYGDTILIPAGPVIELTAGVLEVLDKGITIQGAGPGQTVIDGGKASRVLGIGGLVPVSVRSLTIRNGKSEEFGGGLAVGAGSVLSLTDVVISGNESDVSGGGIFVDGAAQVSIVSSSVTDNAAVTRGGGIAAHGAGTRLLLTNVTISGNRVGGFGGGLEVFGADVSANGVTITGNRVERTLGFGDGGGISNDSGSGGTLALANTIVAGNTVAAGGSSPDCLGPVISRTGNLVEVSSGCTGLLFPDLTGVSAGLGPLGLHGGTTPNHVPASGSPAIDGGTGACLPVDQRGVPRPQGARCDIGAVESGGTVPLAYDFDGDGVADVVVGAGRGDEPRVRVLSGADGTEILSFLAFPPDVRSGVRVAVCDVTGDRVPDIVATPGGPGPVRLFDGASGQPLAGVRGGFDAVPPGSRSAGLTVACADVNGDGVPDILVGVPGRPGVEAQVLSFSGVDATPLGATGTGLHGGVFVAP